MWWENIKNWIMENTIIQIFTEMGSYGYSDWVNFIFLCLTGVFGLLAFHFVFFGIAGVFFKKKFPHTDEKLRYGIIIPTRNEELVVGNLIDSIKKNNYPMDKVDIFVIAHNCTDKTADKAREKGALVYEYDNDNERTKGYAIKYLIKQIDKDYGVKNYDGFFILDADNVLTENYIEKMNDAFVACGKKDIITSFRNSKNFGKNLISAMYGIYFIYGCRLESRGRTALGCSTRVSGTGYLLSSKVVEDGWKYVTLTEDWELSADQVIAGNKIRHCDEAMFYDEQPTKFGVMWTQKVRWAKGHLLVFVTRFKDILRSQFKRKSKGGCPNKGSLHDLTINILPIMILTTVFTIAQVTCLLFSPLAGENLGAVMLEYLTNTATSLLTTYITVTLTAILLCVIEHKRIKNVGFFRLVGAILMFPIFVASYFPQEIQALFSKNLAWKTIPHDDETGIDDIEAPKDGNENK